MHKCQCWCTKIGEIVFRILYFVAIGELALAYSHMSTKISSLSMRKSLGFGGQYKLLDFGHGHRLEQFGKYRVRRPCPIAIDQIPTLSREEWNLADICYVGKERNNISRNSWLYKDHVVRVDNDVADWTLSCGNNMRFILNTYDSGQLGIFPEQLDIWNWLEKFLGDYFIANSESSEPFMVLNGFGYTGGSTMACLASPFVQVTHLDASKIAVKLAKNNIKLVPSATPHSVRWIVDDCMLFLNRELKRITASTSSSSYVNDVGSKVNKGYKGIILDPPAFGRDSKGNIWKLDKDMPRLFESIPLLLHQDPSFVIVSCHDPLWSPNRLADEMFRCLPAHLRDNGEIRAKTLYLHQVENDRRLNFGSVVLWSRKMRY